MSTMQHLSPDGIWRRCTAFKIACTYERRESPTESARGDSLPAPTRTYGQSAELDLPLAWGSIKWNDPARKRVLHVAPIDTSPYSCKTCGTYASKAQEAALGKDMHESFTCLGCGRELWLAAMALDLRGSEAKLLSEVAVRNARWYHISPREDWDEGTKVQQVMTHLGSKEAALDRLRQVMRAPIAPATYYLYEVALKLEAPVLPELVVDQLGSWPEQSNETGHGKHWYLQAGGVSRYMNQYEEPGTISLLADPESYEVVNRLEIPNPLALGEPDEGYRV
jgi:hypothetical protein